MYQQVLYQAVDKLNNTLQSNNMSPVQRLVYSLVVISMAAGAVFIAYRETKKFDRRINQYKTK